MWCEFWLYLVLFMFLLSWELDRFFKFVFYDGVKLLMLLLFLVLFLKVFCCFLLELFLWLNLRLCVCFFNNKLWIWERNWECVLEKLFLSFFFFLLSFLWRVFNFEFFCVLWVSSFLMVGFGKVYFLYVSFFLFVIFLVILFLNFY